jgi:hypothetical protein
VVSCRTKDANCEWQARCEWGLSSFEEGAISSAVFAGIFV